MVPLLLGYLLLLFIYIELQLGFNPVAVVLQDTQKRILHKITYHAKNTHIYKATRTMKGILQPMITMQKKKKK
jgi:hypothetical protein